MHTIQLSRDELSLVYDMLLHSQMLSQLGIYKHSLLKANEIDDMLADVLAIIHDELYTA